MAALDLARTEQRVLSGLLLPPSKHRSKRVEKKLLKRMLAELPGGDGESMYLRPRFADWRMGWLSRQAPLLPGTWGSVAPIKPIIPVHHGVTVSYKRHAEDFKSFSKELMEEAKIFAGWHHVGGGVSATFYKAGGCGLDLLGPPEGWGHCIEACKRHTVVEQLKAVPLPARTASGDRFLGIDMGLVPDHKEALAR